MQITIFQKILKFSSDSVKSYGAQYDAFWIFMLAFYLMPPFTWSYWTPGPYPNSIILAIRLLSFFLGIAIAFRNYWPKRMQPFLPLFWHFTLFFWCPFRTIFIVLNSAHSQGFAVFGFLGIFLLALSTDEVMYSILLGLSLIITPIFFYSTGGLATTFPDPKLVIQSLWIMATITVFKWAFFRHQRNQAVKQINAYQKVASTIAHEMRVPLSSISMSAKGIRLKIEKGDLEGIEKVQSHIQKLVEQAQITIDMLLFKFGKNISKLDGEKCSVISCIREALKEYPFEKGEKNKVTISMKQDDISFYGNHRLFVHVLFNLIKNSLHAIKEAGKGEILIYLEPEKSLLRFRDTAIGICPTLSKNLFREFYTTKSDGTGMGLAFCKSVFANIGGEITCCSEKGLFTEFQMQFPDIDRKEKTKK